MRLSWATIFVFSATTAFACENAVCVVDPDALALTRIITFDDTLSSRGPGRQIPNVLVMDGAAFGERFAGQSVEALGDHDMITGTALAPLTIMPGENGENLSIVYFDGNNILNGYGKAGYPKRHAQGEGAISFLFDDDQSALSFQVRGGEAGEARATFFSRDGNVIDALDLPPTGEHHYGFIRANGAADIAGIVITNTDPQGIALDNLRFEKSPDVS